MKAKLSLMALLMMGSLASAVTEDLVLWDSSIDPEKKNPVAAYSFEYYYPKVSTNKARMVADTAGGVITLTASDLVKNDKNPVGVGYGIIYKQTADYEDATMSLAAYSGLCITYSSEQKFRLDFKQFNINDDNFYGMTMAASPSKKKQFIAFDDLKQGWTSKTETKFSQTLQQGLQFSFKQDHLKSGVTGNVIKIYELVFGNECETFPTTVVAPYDEDGKETLPEGKTLSFDLSKMFTDPDGDALVNVSVISGKKYVKIVDAKESYSLSDVVVIEPYANVDGEALVTFEASDGVHAAVSYSVSITVQNVDQPPLAVDDSYSLKEDEAISVTIAKGILVNDYDPDVGAESTEEPFSIAEVTDPAHGTLDYKEDGSFSYIPNKDFCGTDTWTYTLVSDDDEEMVSKPATVSMKVSCVNDKPVVEILDEEAINVTMTVPEDFDPGEVDALVIPASAIKFSDPDGDETLSYGVATNGLIKATYKLVASNYVIELSPVLNANGDALVALYATDKTDTVAVLFAVTVEPVVDPPLAANDTVAAFEDSLLTVKAAKGVLANDMNPDDVSVPLKAVLDKTTEHGELTFEEDGSFTYMPEADFVGEDSFTYFAITDDDDETESNVATVTILVADMNDAPVLALDTNVIDTVLAEDFSKALVFNAATVKKWFTDPDGDTLEYTVKSDDGKLAPTYFATGLQIKSVKDSVGDAYVTFTADDKNGGKASLKIHVKLTPVNDKPVLLKNDTLYVKEVKNWSVSVDLNDYVSDIDDDTLKFTPQIPAALSKKVQVEVDGSKLTVSGYKDVTYAAGEMVAFGVQAADSLSHVTISVYVVIGAEKGPTGLFPAIASSKTTWQNAVSANRGTVSIMDMHGRVMWTAKLPVSEADVRNAAARVQGRKVLKVNSQVWTIK